MSKDWKLIDLEMSILSFSFNFSVHISRAWASVVGVTVANAGKVSISPIKSPQFVIITER